MSSIQPSSSTGLSRRDLLTASVAAVALGASHRGVAESISFDRGVKSPASLASDEAYWRSVAKHYDRTQGIVNLEQGYWAKMANPVKETYFQALEMVNTQTSLYARKDYNADMDRAVMAVADGLGAKPTEIAITENATESFHNLMRQYRGFERGDGVLMADIDYPAFKRFMRWQALQNQGPLIEVTIPERANQDEVFQQYLDAFNANPSIKLMLVTHVSNQHGLVVPVARIAAEARKRGITVICDAAQSWGLLDFSIADLGVDFAAFNLHKWIGAPLGLGALYISESAIDTIAPFHGDAPEESSSIRARVHPATRNFAATLVIPRAFEFHQAVGPAAKEARLKYLRTLWVDEARAMPHIEVLGGTDAASITGISSFRIRGKKTVADAVSLQKRLEEEFGVFTVMRDGLNGGACVRITPQVFNTPDDIDVLVSAMGKLG